MRYISTRGGGAPRTFTQILLEGLAPDGGLYMPAEYPQLDAKTLEEWAVLLKEDGYSALAAKVLSLYIDDISPKDLEQICAKAYDNDKFSDPLMVPVSQLREGLWLAHLSNGPTAAFKDMAMQLLGELFEWVLAKKARSLNILGATSGDTGSSAEYAMASRKNIKVFMLTPAGRMSPFQQAQMFSLTDPNIHNLAIDGVFDDCQDIVKTIAGDLEFKRSYSIGAVNSINWARLLAQLVYYISCYLRVANRIGDKVSFSVPTGNFGDVCAGHIARQMGLPIDKLIVATNENNVLEEFFRTGRYRVRPASETLATSSPSMDISKASNFERFIFDLLDRDGKATADLFGRQLAEKGLFDLSDSPAFAKVADYGFISGSSTHADRIEQIRDWDRQGVQIDPHTADGLHVAEQLRDRCGGPVVVLETALPVKFADTIEEATGHEPEVPARFVGIMDGPRRVEALPNDAQKVKDFIRANSK